jgi:hypothetical protein
VSAVTTIAAKQGDLSLAAFDVARASEHPDISEKIIRKLRAGMMPPAGARRPDEAMLLGLRRTLETQMDRWAAANPILAGVPFQRLTRAEYAHSVRDLLDVDVDVTAFLPPDTMSQGFDNIADTQAFSPRCRKATCARRARSAASPSAIARRRPPPSTYLVPATENQMLYVEGTPFGSRGGTAFVHTFPADGLYKFQATLVRTVSGELFGNTAVYMAGKKEQLEISVNGERVAVIEVDYGMSDAGEKGLTLETPPIAIKAGPQRIAAAFVPRSVGPVDDLLAPIEFTLVDTRIGTGYGVTMAPHLQDLAIAGPISVTGVSETPSRRKIFHVSSDGREPGAPVRRRDPAQARHAGLPRSGARRHRRPPLDLRSRAQGRRRLRGRDSASASRASWRIRASCSAPSRPCARRTACIASPTSISRRGCRSSSGARCPTRRC